MNWQVVGQSKCCVPLMVLKYFSSPAGPLSSILTIDDNEMANAPQTRKRQGRQSRRRVGQGCQQRRALVVFLLLFIRWMLRES
jgi:hypothetical protein